MIEYLVLGLAWLVLTSPIAVLIGKCISSGQAGDKARQAAFTSEPGTTSAQLQTHTVHPEDEKAASTPEAGALPAQRQPAIPPAHAS